MFQIEYPRSPNRAINSFYFSIFFINIILLRSALNTDHKTQHEIGIMWHELCFLLTIQFGKACLKVLEVAFTSITQRITWKKVFFSLSWSGFYELVLRSLNDLTYQFAFTSSQIRYTEQLRELTSQRMTHDD